MKYSGTITGGSLLVRESRIAARLLLDGVGEEEARRQITFENLFQNTSASTTKRYCGLIFPRLAQLSPDQLLIVAGSDDSATALTLLVANLKSYPILSHFMVEVVAQKANSSEPKLTAADWGRFLEERANLDPEVENWTDSTRQKVGEVISRMLAEAGYIDSTRRRNIQFPSIPESLEDTLSRDDDRPILNCLQLARV